MNMEGRWFLKRGGVKVVLSVSNLDARDGPVRREVCMIRFCVEDFYSSIPYAAVIPSQTFATKKLPAMNISYHTVWKGSLSSSMCIRLGSRYLRCIEVEVLLTAKGFVEGNVCGIERVGEVGKGRWSWVWVRERSERGREEGMWGVYM